MVAINFKKIYAPKVESGSKTQTIRRKARAKPGDKLQLYTGMRTKGCRKLMDAVCCAVDSVSITQEAPFFGQPGWWPKDKNVFAKRDGFQTYADMYEFFKETYGFGEDGYIFNGYVIMWNPTDSKIEPSRR